MALLKFKMIVLSGKRRIISRSPGEGAEIRENPGKSRKVGNFAKVTALCWYIQSTLIFHFLILTRSSFTISSYRQTELAIKSCLQLLVFGDSFF